MKNKDGEIIIPFFAGVTYPVRQIASHFKSFVYLTAGISFFNLIVSFLLGRSFLCGGGMGEGIVYCSNRGWAAACSFLTVWFGLAFYINRWFLISYNGLPIDEAVKTRDWKKDAKTAGFILFYWLMWGAAGLAVYWLNIRVPVESWVKELLFFFAMSLIILLAFILIANAVLFVRFLQGKDWWTINRTFWPVFDNLYKLVGWFVLYLGGLAFILGIIFDVFMREAVLPLWISNILGEFCFNFVLYAGAAIFVSALAYQAQFVFEDEA